MRRVMACFTWLTCACGAGGKKEIIPIPAFVHTVSRVVGSPGGASLAWKPEKAKIRIAGCSLERDNRAFTVHAESESLQTLGLGSAGCQAELESLSCQSGTILRDFFPEKPLEFREGNHATFQSGSGESLEIVIERGLSDSLEHFETLAFAIMPVWTENRLAAEAAETVFSGETPLPDIVFTSVQPRGELEGGWTGLDLFLECRGERNGASCGEQSLLDMRFAFVERAPETPSREAAWEYLNDLSLRIVPNESHFVGNGLRFGVTVRREKGEASPGSWLVAGLGNSLRVFAFHLDRVKF